MSHAEVRALLEAAVLVPGRLRALSVAETEEGLALRRHMAECPDCMRELRAWQAVDEALVAVTPPTLTAPPAARSRILADVVATGVARGPDRVLGSASAAAAADGVASPQAPVAGRVWRTPGGEALPSPTPIGAHPSAATPPAAPDDASVPPVDAADPSPSGRRGLRALSGRGGDREGIGFRVFLAVAAAAVFLFALGAALGGPLGLTTPATVTDTTARVELEKVMGRFADLLQLPGATVAPLTDQAGEPAGAVVIALPDTNLLAVVTRALPPLPDGTRYVCILDRDGERFDIGYMKFASDPGASGDVAYWIGPLNDQVPLDAGRPGDTFGVYVEGDTGGAPLLTTTF